MTVLLILAAITVIISMLQRSFQGELMIRLLLTCERAVVDLPMEDYLVGVVLAEMPASFESEALKAQAVCARTYTLKKHFSNTGHELHASICDDISHCQAYIAPSTYLKRHPDNKWAIKKVQQAVLATRGEVITLEGELVEPVYHSTCGGHTESSHTVWGNEHGYLQGVSCLWDRSSPYYRKTLNISREAFQRALNLDPQTPLIPRRQQATENGTVKEIAWGNTIMNGQQVRQALKLPSAKFAIAVTDETVAITTMGNGHGVGLCQYGANGLAQRGKNYRQILHHYYQGISLYKVSY